MRSGVVTWCLQVCLAPVDLRKLQVEIIPFSASSGQEVGEFRDICSTGQQ